MEVIGICRFSYPALGGFQVDFPTLEEKQAYLYAPRRMEARLRSFETITLPSLRGQTDPDFTLVVVIGDSLPDPYRARLDALLAGLPQAQLQVFAPERHRKVMRRAVNSVRRIDRGPSLQFRIDDDDAVAVNFVERLRSVAADATPLARRYPFIGIDFNRGYIIRPGPSGIAAAPTTTPYTTAGLAVMIQPEENASIMDFTHNRLAERMTTITLTDQDMMIRGHDDWNDSRQKPWVKPVELAPLDRAGEAHFRTTYNIDADHVRRVFSAA